MRAIILAGGTGSRLWPLTRVVSKQLLPIYDKPMIYYPLSTCILAGIREILIISTPQDIDRFRLLFGNGVSLGMSIEYKIQETPAGIAEALIIGASFIRDHPVMLILGDNLFFGAELQNSLRRAVKNNQGATIFGYPVNDPHRYGVVEFEEDGRVLSIEEKPTKPKSNYAVTGLYLFDNDVISIAGGISPGPRGELEITSVNQEYLSQGRLVLEAFGRGTTWLDTGTPESLQEAGEFVKVIQNRQGLLVSSPEELAWRNKWISDEQLLSLAHDYGSSSYGLKLKGLLKAQNSGV